MRLLTHHKLFASYAAVVLAVILILLIGVDAALRPPMLAQAEDELRRAVALGREIYDAEPYQNPDSLARQLAGVTDHRVTIIADDGDVLGDSGVPPADVPMLENHAARPEVRQSLELGSGTDVRRSTSVDVDLLYVAARSSRGDIIRFAVGTEQIDDAIAAVRHQILLTGLLAVLVVALMSVALSIAATRPLRRMRDIATAMAAGDLSRRVGTSRNDEIGDLGRSLDTLSDELAKRLGQLEAERAEMTTLVDSMTEGVVAFARDGSIRRANPAAHRIFDISVPIAHQAPEALTRKDEYLEIVQRALSGEAVTATEITADRRHLIATAHPLPDGGAVLVLVDVTELRRLEDVRRDFVANASHELKTPLTAIRGYSETLLNDDLPPETRRRFTETLSANVSRLQNILDDLLDLSRIESGGWILEYEVMHLADVIEDAWQPLAAMAAEKEVRLEVDIRKDAQHIVADRAAIRQILSNLLSNAARYSPSGGATVVRASRSRNNVHIEVSDSGSGVPEAHLTRIFERFYRVDPARSRSDGGTGLGLAIVRHLVEQHGGRVWAESALGQGTTIHFVLPHQE